MLRYATPVRYVAPRSECYGKLQIATVLHLLRLASLLVREMSCAQGAGVSVANPGRKPTRPRSVAPWLALLSDVLLITYQ